MVAALYVQPRSVYHFIDGVDCWDEERDARTYPGTAPVVAHPPCATWGRWAYKAKQPTHDCFYYAAEHVACYGGILEHPAESAGWREMEWARPQIGLWTPAGDGGWTTEVLQRNYGHLAKKRTWLYYRGRATPPELNWGPPPSTEWYVATSPCTRRRIAAGLTTRFIGQAKAEATPWAFARLLVSIAKSAV